MNPSLQQIIESYHTSPKQKRKTFERAMMTYVAEAEARAYKRGVDDGKKQEHAAAEANYFRLVDDLIADKIGLFDKAYDFPKDLYEQFAGGDER